MAVAIMSVSETAQPLCSFFAWHASGGFSQLGAVTRQRVAAIQATV